MKIIGLLLYGRGGMIHYLERKNHYLEILNSKLEGKTTTLIFWIQKLEGKTTTLNFWIQISWSSSIFFPVFSLIQFWILIRNELYHPQSIAKYVSMGNLKLQSLIYFSALVSCSGSISRTQSLWWHIAICFIAYFQYVLPSLDLYRWLQCCFILSI